MRRRIVALVIAALLAVAGAALTTAVLATGAQAAPQTEVNKVQIN
jgi:hypothetical protein